MGCPTKQPRSCYKESSCSWNSCSRHVFTTYTEQPRSCHKESSCSWNSHSRRICIACPTNQPWSCDKEASEGVYGKPISPPRSVVTAAKKITPKRKKRS